MKKLLLLLFFLGLSLFVKAQNKITFDYDLAGNQITRSLCLKCTNSNYRTTTPKEIAALTETDLLKFTPEDVISYYPNPVKEELYIKWELVANKTVTTIALYDLNGRVLQTYTNLEKANNLNIPFLNYPEGVYLVNLIYNDGDQKSIKIVK